MKKTHKILLGVLAFCILTVSCKKDDVEECIPTPEPTDNGHVTQFYSSNGSTTTPNYTVIANASNQVITPQDLDFHPNRNGELWILNKGTVSSGSSTVTISGAGKSGQTFDRRKDGNAWHFMSLSTALDFSPENSNFGTAPGVYDANHNGSAFTGPSLWTSDMAIYARPSGGNGSHLDMLHQSPYCMGIAHEKDNIFWIFDGNSSQIVKYDFKTDHGPGNADHDDGEVDRYIGISVSRKAGVPSHMVIDKSTGWMYICDTGNKRILRMKINSGNVKRNLPFNFETLAQHREMENPEWEVFADVNLVDPCGIEVHGNRLFVSDNSTNKIIAYRLDTKEELARIQTTATGIKGITVGPEGKLWYVDYSSNQVVRVDPA